MRTFLLALFIVSLPILATSCGDERNAYVSNGGESDEDDLRAENARLFADCVNRCVADYGPDR